MRHVLIHAQTTLRVSETRRVWSRDLEAHAMITPIQDPTALSIDEQVAWLMQGTNYGDEETKRQMTRELRERLSESQRTGAPLRVYCGYDPTKPDLHLGHTITMRKLRQFQDLGHDVTFLIGSYTSLVGDPSDKNKARPVLGEAEVVENARTYVEQAFMILDRDKTTVRHNGEWLAGLRLLDLIQIGQNFTVQQFLTARELRQPAGARRADLPARDLLCAAAGLRRGGAADRRAGRRHRPALQHPDRRPQAATGHGPEAAGGADRRHPARHRRRDQDEQEPGQRHPDPGRAGRHVRQGDVDPDHAMPLYFELATRFLPAQVAEVEQALADGTRHPRDLKMELAREIVSIFHGDDAAAGGRGALPHRFPAARAARRHARSAAGRAGEPAGTDDRTRAGGQQQRRRAGWCSRAASSWTARR